MKNLCKHQTAHKALAYFRMPGETHSRIWPQLGLTSSNKDLFHICKCVSDRYHGWTLEEGFGHKMHQMKPWNHGKYSVFEEVNVYHLQRCLCWIWSTGVLYSHSPGICSLHRSQSCYSPFQSSSWINKTKHPQHAAPRAAMLSHIFHLWFLPPENVSDSQQGGPTEQPKPSHWVTSTNWEKEKSNFKVA